MIVYYSGNAEPAGDPEQVLRERARIMLSYDYILNQKMWQDRRFRALYEMREKLQETLNENGQTHERIVCQHK